MNKTADIEFAILDHLNDGSPTIDQLIRWLSWVDDPRWVMVALTHLQRDGKIRCDDLHTGTSKVEAIAR